MTSSVIPSAKYSSLGSELMLAKGRMATLLLSSCDACSPASRSHGIIILYTSTGRSTFFTDLLPRVSKRSSNLPRTWSYTCWVMVTPPSSASGSTLRPSSMYPTMSVNMMAASLRSPVPKLCASDIDQVQKINPFWNVQTGNLDLRIGDFRSEFLMQDRGRSAKLPPQGPNSTVLLSTQVNLYRCGLVRTLR